MNDANFHGVSVLCPTRGRPQQLRNMIESAISKSSNSAELEFVLYVDLDDNSYDSIKFSEIHHKIKIFRGPKIPLSAMFNLLMTQSTGAYLFWSGDDVEFLTKDWDKALMTAITRFPDKLAVAHADDMSSYPQIYATIGMVHRNWCTLFGAVFTPHMKDNGIDFWISEIARDSRRLIFCPEVRIEHLQYRQGKSNYDATYQDRRKEHSTYDINNLYFKLRGERRRESLILMRAIGLLPRLKRGFLFSSSLIRFRARRKSNNVISDRDLYIGSLSDFEISLKFLLKSIGLNRRIRLMR